MKNKTANEILTEWIDGKKGRNLPEKYAILEAMEEYKNQPPSPRPAQLCPKCNGEGYCPEIGNSTNSTRVCPVCEGGKILYNFQAKTPTDIDVLCGEIVAIATEKFNPFDACDLIKAKLIENFAHTQQQEIDRDLIQKDHEIWNDSFITNREYCYISYKDHFQWFKQRPEFSQPTGQQDKQITIDNVGEIAVDFAEYIAENHWHPRFDSEKNFIGYFKPTGQGFEEKNTDGIFELFLTKKQK